MTDDSRSELPPPPPYPPPAAPSTILVSSEPTPPRRSRGPVVALAVVGAAIVVCLAVAVPMLAGDQKPADLTAVRSYDGLEVAHTSDDVDYPQHPAVGGPHDPSWLDCGVYDDPVREENAVHDLEHGSVWISYDPHLGRGDVKELAGLLPQNGIMAPYPGLDAPVVVTVWGRQLDLDGADDPRLKLFIKRYGGGETAPEPFASCAGGVSEPGGTPPGTSI